MKIGLDFDGVVTDCGVLKSEGAKRLYGLDISPEKFKKEIIINNGILTADQYVELQRQIYETREFGLKMIMVPEAQKYINMLCSEGHDLEIITSRGGNALSIAKEYIAINNLSISLNGIGGGISKAEACIGLDVYVDDDLNKLIPLVGIVPHLFLFNWGYNKNIEIPKEITRVDSWEYFYKEVNNL